MNNTSVEQAAQKPPHILVADDDLGLRNLLCYCLKGKVYQVSPTSNGQEAFDLFSADKFDLVILDVDMPLIIRMGCLCADPQAVNNADYDGRSSGESGRH